MADATPLINELKEASGSDKLNKCFKFLFIQDHTEEEAFIRWVGEKCNEVKRKIDIGDQRMAEVLSLNDDEEEAAGDTYECLRQKQVRNRRRLEALRGILFKIREGLTENERHMTIMDFYDD
ncbi:hypothetical protein CTI12_AA514350 [Artemisia annua]|uniref:Uncharacterized protein n=1 Tax=Artemisia annua TaxID=35608 RepID=A0A2U1LB95_ARTAN|nr:hypothetical protein CTI12_AA514350 [Artemisia annua]